MLSDIGFSFVAAVNRSGISSSHAPGHILLPSSLYRIGPANKNDEASLLNMICLMTLHVTDYMMSWFIFLQANSRCLIVKSCLDEFFIKRVIHIFKSQIALVCISMVPYTDLII